MTSAGWPDTDAERVEAAWNRVVGGWSVGTAESCTGGAIAQHLVAVPGSGEWFAGALVAYDARLKFDLLGVRPGPVICAEAAMQMAEGASRLLGVDVAVSSTGCTGPTCDEGRPVGTVFVAVAGPFPTEVAELHLEGEPDEVRAAAVEHAVALLGAVLHRARDASSGADQAESAASGMATTL